MNKVCEAILDVFNDPKAQLTVSGQGHITVPVDTVTAYTNDGKIAAVLQKPINNGRLFIADEGLEGEEAILNAYGKYKAWKDSLLTNEE